MDIKSWLKDKSSTFKDDLIAGFIVAIVALPLSIGFAIASNVPLTMGILAAIIGGLFVAIMGGSNYQIAGPSGTLVIITLAVVSQFGLTGLILATILAGIILILLGLFKMGKIIEYIPSPVIIGFTAGIALVIVLGQINNFFGINPSYPAGIGVIQKTWISLMSVGSANIAAVILAMLTIAILIIMPRLHKKIPGSIVAVVVTTSLAVLFSAYFHVRNVGDIGKIDLSFGIPTMPVITWSLLLALLPAALTIAAIVAIESLLTAVVADGMTDTRHNPNKELLGQGVANIMSALFGGMPLSGATARTATNIRSGAKTRLAGVFHAIFILIFIVLLGFLAVLIPLATLAGILMFVAYNMVDWSRVAMIFRTPMSDVAVMITTFLLTVLVGITAAIEVGLLLAAVLFMKRMSDLYKVEEYDSTDDKNELVKKFKHNQISIYTINGPLFFGAASRLDQQLATTPGGHKPIKIIRMKYVPVIDATGLSFIESTYKKHKKMGGVVLFSSVHPDVMKLINNTGLEKKIGIDHFFPTTRTAIVHALKHAHKMQGEPEEVSKEDMEKYNLHALDVEEEMKVTATNDVDPVQEIFDSFGITTAQKISKRGMKSAKKLGENSIKTVHNLGVQSVHGAQELGEKSIKTVGHIGEESFKKVHDIGVHGVEGVQKFGKKSITVVKKATKKKKW